MRTGLVLIAIAMVLTTKASASTLVGAGVLGCDTFTGMVRDVPEQENIFFNWAQGFMTGINKSMAINQTELMDLSAMSVEQQKPFIRTYCVQKPSQTYGGAVTELVLVKLPQKPGTTSLAGWGAVAACKQATELHRRNLDVYNERFVFWADGFLSGLSALKIVTGQSQKDLISLSPEEQDRQLQLYCNQHPSHRFLEATLDLYNNKLLLPRGSGG